MSWTRQSIDDVKRAARVEDIIGYDAALKREGDDLVGCCVLPGHKDDSPSLRVTPSKGVWKCHGCNSGGSAVDWLMKMHGMRFPEAMCSLSASTGVDLVDAPRDQGERCCVARYVYVDVNATALYTIERWEPGKDGRKKDFVQRLGLNGAYTKSPTQVLFNLPAVIEAARVGGVVYVSEGEKAANAVSDLGGVSTTHAGGASATKTWTAEFAAPLKGAHVVLLPDNDDAGTKLMKHVAGVLNGIAAGVVTIHLPVEGKGDDAVEWIAAGGTLQKLRALAEASRTVPPSSTPVDDRLTDTGNAERFVRLHGNNFRFDKSAGHWLSWSSKHWERDTDDVALRATKDVARSFLVDVVDAVDSARRIKLVKHATTSESKSGRQAMLALAATEETMAVRANDLDADPWVFNCRNGTIDLRNGKLRAHRREDLATKMSPVEFDPDALCPVFDAFLESSIPDEPTRAFLMRFFGYCLTGIVSEHIFPVLWGLAGRNGKGTLIETMFGVFGGNAMPVPTELIIESKHEPHPNMKAQLLGARLAVAAEIKSSDRLAESSVKTLTGGDSIRARFLGKEFFTFAPTHKLVLQTNFKPRVSGGDPALWARMRVVPFTVSFIGREDLQLKEKLAAERAGILARLVRACLEWQRDGLGASVAIDEATAEYRDDSDTMGAFVSERCKLEAGAKTMATMLYRDYRTWAEGRGDHPWTQTMFGREVTQKGFRRVKIDGYPHYYGLLLRAGDGPSGVAARQSDGSDGLPGLSHINTSHGASSQKTIPSIPYQEDFPEMGSSSDDDDFGWRR